MELTPERLPAQLAAEPLRPAYLVAGPEPLRVLEAADAVRVQARAEGIDEREVFEADARDFDWDTLASTFRAPSLFATRRLVELRLPTAKPGKDGAEAIAEFCREPPQDVVLLVTGGEWSRQHGGKWSEAIARIGHVVVAWQVKPHELPDWIERRLRARGLVAQRDAVERLAERVEGNLLAAAQEIDKLALLLKNNPVARSATTTPPLPPGEGKGRGRPDVEEPASAPRGATIASREDAASMAQDGILTADMMDALVADAARFDVFRLVDAAMNGQGAQVSRMLAGLRAEGDAVPALLGMVVMELQRGAALARVQARGGNLGAEFKAQRIWESKQAAYRRALQRHPAARWERFVVEAGQVDRIAKGRAPGDAWQRLERLLLAVAERTASGLVPQSPSAAG